MPSIIELEQKIARLEEEIYQLKHQHSVVLDTKNNLSETEILHTSIINSTNDLIWAVEATNFELLSFNNGFLDFFKKAGHSIRKGMPPEHFLPENLAEKWREQYTYTLKRGNYSAQFNTVLNNRTLLLTFNVLKKDDQVWGISVFARDITEQKRAEQQLRQSEDRFKAIADSAPIAMVVVNLNEHSLYLNDYFTSLFGYTQAEITSEEAWQQLAYPNDEYRLYNKQCWQKAFEKAAQNNTEIEPQEFTVQCKDGTVRDIEFRIALTLEYKIVMGFDITARRLAHEAIAKSDRNYREIFDATSDALLVHDKDGLVFMDVNQAAIEMYGFENKDEMRGLSIDHLSATEQGYTIERAIALMQKTQNEKQHTFEWIAKRKNQTLFWCEVSLKRGVINNTVHTIAAVRDISYRKAIESALDETKDSYQSLYEGMIDAYVAVTMDGKIVECNQAYCNMLGYSKSEVANLRYQEVTPEKWHAYEASILEKQVLTRSYSEVYEKEYRRRTGEVFPIELRTHLIKRNDELVGLWAIVRDISERKRAELALRESEERYRKITESITDYIYRVEIDSNNNNQVRTQHSEASSAIIGYQPKEFELNPNLWFEIIHADDRQAYINFLLDFLQTAQNKTIEHRIIHKNGEMRWVSNTLLAFETINGYVNIYEGIIKDITERKQAEQALNESKARYEALFENSITSNSLYDDQMRVVLMNKKALQVLKLEAKDVIGKITSQVLDRAQAQIIEQRIRTVLETGKLSSYESKFVMPLGEMWFQTIYMPIHNNQQQITGVLAISQDVSEQKQLEISIRKSEDRFRTLYNNAPLGIALIDSASGQIITLNAMYAQIAGLSIRDMLSTHWLQTTHLGDVQTDEAYLAQLSAGNIKSYNIEKRFVHPDGSIVWVNSVVTRLQTDDNSAVQYIAMIEDITERKKLEQQLFTITLQTEEQERQRFAQELHDGIGPLLAAANMYIEWILKPNSKADVVSNLEKIHSIIKDAHRTIRQISFNLSPHILQNFGLHTALESYCQKIRESSNIAIVIDCQCTMPRNELLETTLYRILTECITNTLKHAQASEIHISMCRQQQHQIRYHDNGLGFDVASLSHTGLGLQNMQNRIKALNGNITIDSAKGKGTTIIIDLNID